MSAEAIDRRLTKVEEDSRVISEVAAGLLERADDARSRLSRVELRLGTMNLRLGAIDDKVNLGAQRLANVEERLGDIENNLILLDEKVDERVREVLLAVNEVLARLPQPPEASSERPGEPA